MAHPSPVSVPSSEPISTGDLYRTTSDELVALERKQGAAAALAELGTRIADDPRVAGICHAIAHDLGHEAIAEAGGNASKALRSRDDVCGGGFTHGVIEVALGSSKHPARDLLTICAPKQDGSCFHGVGHGLMFATGMDVKRSLALCDHAPTALLASRCGEGVFMQLFSADVAGGHTAHAGSEAVTPQSARATCAGTRTIKYHPEDPTIGARVCAQAGDLGDSCLAGMGSYWSVHFRGERAASDVCRHLGDADLARRCRGVT